MSRSENRIDFLDHIRGVAIIGVLVFHSLGSAYGIAKLRWHGWLPDFDVPGSFLLLFPATFGWLGVAVFFVVSGFCIHLSHQRAKDEDLRAFFIRRFFRIYPPYLAALLIFSFLYPWHEIRLCSPPSLARFCTHLFLVHNLHSGSFNAINMAFWSVAVEFQLYLLYPLVLVLVGRLT